MDYDTAKTRALIELAKLEKESGYALSLSNPENVIEANRAWLFFYNATEFLVNGDRSARLAGNGPIVVMKSDGVTSHYGTALSVKEILAMLN